MRLLRIIPAVILCLLVAAASAEPLRLLTIPCGNLSDYHGRMLDRRAAAALATTAPEAWAPVEQAQVQRALDDLALPWPLGTSEAQQLSAHLQTAMVLTGVVKQVQVRPGTAQVTMTVEMMEPLSGELVARATGTGTYQSREPIPVDVRVEQALQLAAQRVWAGLAVTPREVGTVVAPVAGDRQPLTLSGGKAPEFRTLVLLLPPADAPGPPLAAATVEKPAASGIMLLVLGRRAELTPGARAWAIGRLP
ncbi:MAG TPA: hypothetical protein VGM19_05585 [Armatimonadota bacterium]|jgi:hypothetical protein